MRQKKATGFQEPKYCSTTDPTAAPEASTVRDVGASARGCASLVACARATLAAVSQSIIYALCERPWERTGGRSSPSQQPVGAL